MQHRPQSGERLSVAVIGAGIVGCSIALALTMEGHKVTLFDREEPGAGTSYGNAGAIVTGSITPTATPAVIKSLPAYVLDRQSPAVLRVHHTLKALPWMLRFIAAGTPAAVDRIAAAMHPLVSRALVAHRSFAARAEVPELLTQEGWLKVYASAADFDGSALERRLMARHGVVHEILEQGSILDLEPGLDPAFCYRGVRQPNAGNVRFPRGLAEAYLRASVNGGASVIRENVNAIEAREGGGVFVRGEGAQHGFDRVVVAAGAWSGKFAKQLGDRVSLDAERGYHISFGPGSERLLRGPVVIPGRGFVLSPMHDGLRLVSGDELAGLSAPPNYKRIEALLPDAVRVLPALRDWRPASRWMGHRPSTPDTLPVIGPARKSQDVIYAFGHGHLGVTLSAITARLVADLIVRRPSEIDLAPYRATRF
ncbi:NAD(P)/FAD-dependent oxidoreductase [Mycoplana ramosa]|uniref:NAD(P)/FAD-dependent oxidoreductase n=1 Tax=Mycoplana ramosa TaxID=40837 RepID=A0ABW3Z1S4_MYCRA